MNAILTPADKQIHLLTLIGELTKQTALAGTRQTAFSLNVNVYSYPQLAYFHAFGLDNDAKINWAGALGWDGFNDAQREIRYDLFSLQDDNLYNRSIDFLKSALAATKNL